MQLSELKAGNDCLKEELEVIERECRMLDESAANIAQKIKDMTVEGKHLFEDC
jgi:hypothetical protein